MNTVNFYRAMAAIKVFKHSLFSLQLWFPSNITVLRAQMGIMYKAQPMMEHSCKEIF